MKEYGFVGGVACSIVTGSSISTLRTFAIAGWEIASHSMSHPSNMTSLSDSQLDYEIRQSKVTLEQELPECAPVITFAYPWNNYDERVEAVVAQYYEYGRTAAGEWSWTKIWDNLPSALVPGLAISATNYQTDLPVALSALKNTTEGTLVLVFHAIGGLDTDTFKQCLQMIKNAQVPVVTFKDIAREKHLITNNALALCFTTQATKRDTRVLNECPKIIKQSDAELGHIQKNPMGPAQFICLEESWVFYAEGVLSEFTKFHQRKTVGSNSTC